MNMSQASKLAGLACLLLMHMSTGRTPLPFPQKPSQGEWIGTLEYPKPISQATGSSWRLKTDLKSTEQAHHIGRKRRLKVYLMFKR